MQPKKPGLCNFPECRVPDGTFNRGQMWGVSAWADTTAGFSHSANELVLILKVHLIMGTINESMSASLCGKCWQCHSKKMIMHIFKIKWLDQDK